MIKAILKTFSLKYFLLGMILGQVIGLTIGVTQIQKALKQQTTLIQQIIKQGNAHHETPKT